MRKVIIADTSCLIVLSNINGLDILHKMYGQIIVTPEIASEYQDELPEWVSKTIVKDVHLMKTLELIVDKGEASAIALSMETEGSLLIIDDGKARGLADKLDIEFTGTMGVLLKAKSKGIVSAVKPYLDRIQSETNFRLSEELIHATLQKAGE